MKGDPHWEVVARCEYERAALPTLAEALAILPEDTLPNLGQDGSNFTNAGKRDGVYYKLTNEHKFTLRCTCARRARGLAKPPDT